MDSLLRFDQLLELLTWRNVLDVLLVTAIFYNLLLLIRGTRAVQILFGVMVVVATYYSATVLDLPALEATLDRILAVLPFVIIVLFQQEIRRALASFWRTPLFAGPGNSDLDDTINDIVLAASTLAERKIGALLVFERQEGLRDYVDNGIALDAVISLDLLINLFTPDTPTHDGAVIVQGNRLAAATCFLPLTQDPELSKALGTRHRAALGITEETDALSLVVSEETGNISLAFRGHLERGLSSNELRNLLYARLTSNPRELDAA